MKRFVLILVCLLCVGCSKDRSVNPNYESIRANAREAKKRENETYKQSLAEMKVTHDGEQAKYSDEIKHPEKYAEVVDLQTGAPMSNDPMPTPVNQAPAATNGLPNVETAPQTYTLPPNPLKRGIDNNSCPNCKKGNK